ncbi:MAG: IS630 family transposase [Tannerella sp.]|jgi:transposase|nr:IS630 family transposase [Tannerella sp.]
MRTSQKPKLQISDDDLKVLQKISVSRTEPHRSVIRANILLKYYEDKRISQIVKEMKTTRPLVERTINRALAYGVIQGLKDLPGRGAKPAITDDAKSWVLFIACGKPASYGYSYETWTYRLLIKHIRAHCHEAGFECLQKINNGVLNGILSKGNIKPHKISYYLERRDEEFEVKMANVLQVYKEIALINDGEVEKPNQVTLSYDEKPGIQAIKNIAPQLQPVPGKHQTIGRDHEYKRLGTVSLLAGIDLHTGKIISIVRERHRSCEFIELLTEVDKNYPADWKIRIILDNHSAHTSKETTKWLLSKPGRFEFVFTPKHGSWLNMIEMFFSKIARSFLRHIRVQTKDELIERINRGIEEINDEPVIFRWKYKMEKEEEKENIV